MKKILVTGSNGMLGRQLVSLLKNSGHTVTEADLPNFDVTNTLTLEYLMSGKDAVVNCAAYTNVDKAEQEPDLAFKTNTKVPEIIGTIASETGAYVIHIGTDFIFGGEGNEPYSEDAFPNPLSVYGKSKLEGEKAILLSRVHSTIIRLQWTYGIGGSSFVKKILDRAGSGKEMMVVNDQIGSPTSVTDVCKAIELFLQFPKAGVFHYAAKGYVSRYEVAKFILDTAGIDCQIRPCLTSEFNSPAQRPLNSRFCCHKFDDAFPHMRRRWNEALKEFMMENI